MLHAAVVGFPSTGKTTLFQLMTSVRDAPRGKGDVSIGISRVPDARLDTLTAMYNPRKRVPATVEFTDIIAAARAGAEILPVGLAYPRASGAAFVNETFPQHLARMSRSTETRMVVAVGAPITVAKGSRAGPLTKRAHAEIVSLVRLARAGCGP